MLPADAAPVLGVIAQLGVILYMFLVGLELDLSLLRTSVSTTIAISLASIVVPFALGSALALGLLRMRWHRPGSFARHLSCSLASRCRSPPFRCSRASSAIAACSAPPLGTLALTCAAINDAIAWCLLAFVVSVMQADAVGRDPHRRADRRSTSRVMLTVGRALVAARSCHGSIDRRASASRALALVLVAVLLSAVATEFIGIHAIFGAFLLGAIIPARQQGRRHGVTERIADIVRVMFLPAFFAFTGTAHRDRPRASRWQDWLLCALIIAGRHRRQVRRHRRRRPRARRHRRGATAARSAS